MHGVETGSVVLSEPSSMMFASGATCMQTHGLNVCFQVHKPCLIALYVCQTDSS